MCLCVRERDGHTDRLSEATIGNRRTVLLEAHEDNEHDALREGQSAAALHRHLLLVPHGTRVDPPAEGRALSEKELVLDNLLVRIHLIIEINFVDRPCAMGD